MPKDEAMKTAKQLVDTYGSDPDGLLVGAIAGALVYASRGANRETIVAQAAKTKAAGD